MENKIMSANLSACRLCGCTNITIVRNPNRPLCFSINCIGCDLLTGAFDNLENAINFWNNPPISYNQYSFQKGFDAGIKYAIEFNT